MSHGIPVVLEGTVAYVRGGRGLILHNFMIYNYNLAIMILM